MLSNITNAQQFTETDIEIPGIYEGSVAWGDYNNDGLMDFMLTGESIVNGSVIFYSAIFKNNDNNIFTEYNNILEKVYRGNLDWGDYNNDNSIDILLSGKNIENNIHTVYSKVYKNDNKESFLWQQNTNIIPTSNGKTKWCNFLNSNYLGISQSGLSENSNIVTELYKNNTDNTFSLYNQINLEKVFKGDIAWGDYNNDCNIDFIIMGSDGIKQITSIYKNNGDSTFTLQNQFELPNLMNGSVAWGDFNNDSFLDILISGGNLDAGLDIVTTILKNVNGIIFEELNEINLMQVSQGDVIWGDYNNDGLLDVLSTGCGDNPILNSTIYKNIGYDVFVEQTEISIIPMCQSKAGWADYDNDRDLDFLISGGSDGGYVTTKLYRNNETTPNYPPLAITGLQTEITDSTVIFSWDEAIDPNQPSAGLNYNIYVYEEEEPLPYIASPQAFPYGHELNGKRLMPKRGHIQGIRENGRVSYFLIREVFEECKTYYWSVQAIDASFAGGEFPPEAKLVIDTIKPEITCPENITINLTEGQTSYTVTDESLNPTNYTDNCEILSIENNYNFTETLIGEQLPVGTTTITWTATDYANNQNTCNIEIEVNEFVGISEHSQNGFTIFPNPTNGILYINLTGLEDMSGLSIRIIDITGKEVIKTNIINQTTQQIDISQLAKGTYLIKIGKERKLFEVN